MKLLVVTQAVDTDDPVLGFFALWIAELAKHFDHVEVICLKMGKSDLPKNVRVHSLGKERGSVSRATYAWRFLTLAWQLQGEYDAAFVHMNQEYILIAGWLWKLLGKRVYMWRNHYSGSFLTTVAASFCDKVYCTSERSFTARFAKTEFMPVGVDTNRFAPDERFARVPRSILFLSRMAPSKRPDMLIDALIELANGGVSFTATFVGSPKPEDEGYYESLKERARPIEDRIAFRPGIPNGETPDQYRAHAIFVNASPSGMFDKTLFEAAACGCTVLASSADFSELAGETAFFDSAAALTDRLRIALADGSAQDHAFVAHHSLSALGEQLVRSMARRRRPVRDAVWRVLHVIARYGSESRCSIVLYHSISASDDPFAVSPLEFTRQMRYLRSHYETIPLSRAFAHAEGDRVSRDSIAVTFDDGYLDFKTEALPILARYGVPATVFVMGGDPIRSELANEHPLLSEADREALDRPDIGIGSHGVTHRKLTRLSADELKAELQDSRAAISERYGVEPTYLAYPKGSYNASVMAAAKDAGYSGAVTVVERSVRSGDDPFAMPRVEVLQDTSPAVFRAKLTRASDWYHAIWRLAHSL